jgi:hypothetical protein
VAGNGILDEGAKALTEVLPRCANLSELNLWGEWRDEGESTGREGGGRGGEWGREEGRWSVDAIGVRQSDLAWFPGVR